MNSRIETARRLRRTSTDAERRLWYFLRNRQLGGFRFRRQLPIGRYFADFACIEARLAIELDGGQHVDDSVADAERTRRIARAGFRVLRFWNTQALLETESVLESIFAALHEAALDPARSTSHHFARGLIAQEA
jgi:very-short-patch-repair endonuclease